MFGGAQREKRLEQVAMGGRGIESEGLWRIPPRKRGRQKGGTWSSTEG